MLKSVLLAVALAGAALAPAPAAFAAKPAIFTDIFSDLAIGGYDAVSYFQNRPAKGSPQFQISYQNAKWRFVSAENLAAFKANPAKYAPQYGGYCAWAVSQGYTAKGDPAFWKIVGGKLYLNYDATVQKRWEGDIPGFIGKANGNWPRVIQ